MAALSTFLDFFWNSSFFFKSIFSDLPPYTLIHFPDHTIEKTKFDTTLITTPISNQHEEREMSSLLVGRKRSEKIQKKVKFDGLFVDVAPHSTDNL